MYRIPPLCVPAPTITPAMLAGIRLGKRAVMPRTSTIVSRESAQALQVLVDGARVSTGDCVCVCVCVCVCTTDNSNLRARQQWCDKLWFKNRQRLEKHTIHPAAGAAAAAVDSKNADVSPGSPSVYL